jgi:undecaprenyl-diphosphatase
VKEGCGGLYGFFSSHAANSFGIATFFYLTQKKHSNLFKFLFLWALIVSYSRVYIGVHFPIDIVVGICFGIFSGYIFSKINLKFNHNVF